MEILTAQRMWHRFVLSLVTAGRRDAPAGDTDRPLQCGRWIDSHVLGLASARACGDRKAEARMRIQLGYAYYSLRQYAGAADQFTQALTLSRQDSHQLGEGTALEQLALIDLRQGR